MGFPTTMVFHTFGWLRILPILGNLYLGMKHHNVFFPFHPKEFDLASMWLPKRSRFSCMDAGPVESLCHPVLAFVYIPWAYLDEKMHISANWNSWWLILYVCMINLGHVIQTESWILRDLTFIFARTAKRGHRPREPQIRELMMAAEIPVPLASPRSMSSAGSSGSMSLESQYFWRWPPPIKN